MSAIFGYPLTIPAGFEDRSVYLFYLQADGPAKKGGAADAATLAMGSLRPGAGTAASGADFHPNVCVTREKTDRSLTHFVAEQRKLLSERAPKLAVVKEGPAKVAGQPAHQAELQAALDEPRLQLVQWQVVTLRDGYAVCFFCTTTRARWDADRKKFEEFVAGWK